MNCNTEKVPYPVPPLGLCMISASLGANYEVSIYDCMFDEGKGLIERVSQFNPDYIGFSIRNIDSTMSDNPVSYVDDQISKIILPVKAVTSAKIILGGSGFSIFPGELMELAQADYGIIGEGEIAFLELLDTLGRGEAVFPSENRMVGTQERGSNRNKHFYPEKVPFGFSEIDRKIDFNSYKERGAYSIQTKRGCSHSCIYCTYPVLEGTFFRTRSCTDIVNEIEQAHQRLGDVVFEFVDSTFNDPKGHAEAICHEIIRRKLKVRLRTMGINPRNSSEELFDLMMKAGFFQIDATPDTASPAMLKNLGKGFELAEIQNMAMSIRRFNLPTMWFFLFGGPGENERTFNESLEFIDQYVNPEDLVYMASGLRIYPGTPLEKMALSEKVIKQDESLLFPAYYFTKDLSKEKLLQMMEYASDIRINCILSSGTRPPATMLEEANRIRSQKKLNEPMFRTLLRIRKEWKVRGLL